MNDLIKWVLKAALQAVLWTFLLSIHVKNRPIFYHLHGFFVDNAIVHTVDHELARLWDNVWSTGKDQASKSDLGRRHEL